MHNKSPSLKLKNHSVSCLLCALSVSSTSSFAQQYSSGQDQDSELKKAVSRIHNQTDDMTNSYVHEGKRQAQNTSDRWNDVANDHQRQWDEQIQALKYSNYNRGRSFYPGGSMYYPRNNSGSRLQIQDMQQQAAREVQSLRNIGTHSANQIYDSAVSRALGIEQSAVGLESQLARPSNITNSAHLVPNGTSLYVRNYEVTPTSEEDNTPFELTATPGKLTTPILTHQLRQLKNKAAQQ